MPGSFVSLARLPLGGSMFGNALRRDAEAGRSGAAPDAGENPASGPASGPASDTDPIGHVGRRAAPRLRLSIPARFQTVSAARRCVLLDVSRSGAQIGLARALAPGAAGFLTFADVEVFGDVIRTAPGCNGIAFDVELSDAVILEVRRFAETFQIEERRALLEDVRAWVTGQG